MVDKLTIISVCLNTFYENDLHKITIEKVVKLVNLSIGGIAGVEKSIDGVEN